MIDAELYARIRRFYFAEHWKVGTIATELGVHHDTVEHAIEADRFARGQRSLDRRCSTRTRSSSARPSTNTPGCGRPASSR